MKKRVVPVLLFHGMCVGTASTQFDFRGIVHDPSNYAPAVLRYSQLVLQLAQLRQTYTQILNQYNLGLRMDQNLQNNQAATTPNSPNAGTWSHEHVWRHWSIGQRHKDWPHEGAYCRGNESEFDDNDF